MRIRLGDIMPSILNRIYDKFIGTINAARERFGLAPERPVEREPLGLPREPDVHKMEFDIGAGIEKRLELTPWSSIAYLDPSANRFRDSKTGLFLMGDEYRERRSNWRTTFLGELITSRMPYLSEFQRDNIISQIEHIRESDIEAGDKDTAIRDLIGSP
jgi:hypothetical protein